MHVLYVHQNFPAQFGHIARRLVAERGWQCTFVSELPPAEIDGVRRLQYKCGGGATAKTHYLSRTFENVTWHSHAVYETLKAHPEVRPDLIVGHSGLGSTMFLADLYDCPIVNYFEYYYHARGGEMDFRPGEPAPELNVLRARSRNAVMLLDLQTCTLGYSPTDWQRSLFPAEYQPKIETIFDGIDTTLWCDAPRRDSRRGASCHDFGRRIVAGREIPPGTRIVTYVSRGFESIRGFDVFMKAARRICELRRDVVFVCVGSDRVCYSGDLEKTGGKSFREHVLGQAEFDESRFIFTGRVPPQELARIFGLSDLHIYLTMPFILSWSLMNALACGCTVLASDTTPVREMIEHGKNGLLAGFYNTGRFVDLAMEVLDDPAAFRPLGEAGAAMIEAKYSLDRAMPRMVDLYDRAIAAHGSRARGSTPLPDGRGSNASRESPIERLAALHPWPVEKPRVEQPEQRGWYRPANHRMLAKILSSETRVVVELGSWLGLSTRGIADLAPNARVIAIDHWKGSPEHFRNAPDAAVVPQLYESFLAACWDYRDRIVPLRLHTDDGMRLVAELGIQPDLIYVDADHAYEAVKRDLALARELFPAAVLVGDDWGWPTVQRAVCELAGTELFELDVGGNAWRLWRDGAALASPLPDGRGSCGLVGAPNRSLTVAAQ